MKLKFSTNRYNNMIRYSVDNACACCVFSDGSLHESLRNEIIDRIDEELFQGMTIGKFTVGQCDTEEPITVDWCITSEIVREIEKDEEFLLDLQVGLFNKLRERFGNNVDITEVLEKEFSEVGDLINKIKNVLQENPVD